MPQFLQAFFDRYPGFIYDPTQPPTSEFYRLSKSSAWKPDEKDKEIPFFRNALVEEFNALYGREDGDIGDWQRLCRVLAIQPNSVADCLQMTKESIHVNIIDLIHHPQTQTPVELFDSETNLSLYARETGRYFPLGNLKGPERKFIRNGGLGLLGNLLRNIKGLVGKKPKKSRSTSRANVPGAAPPSTSKSARRRRKRKAAAAKKAAPPPGTGTDVTVADLANQLATTLTF